MAKVFTITEGLENLGALKSGGQGSVYKAKRTGGVVSAVGRLQRGSGAGKQTALKSQFITQNSKLTNSA